jgi:hypothetical protein
MVKGVLYAAVVLRVPAADLHDGRYFFKQLVINVFLRKNFLRTEGKLNRLYDTVCEIVVKQIVGLPSHNRENTR